MFYYFLIQFYYILLNFTTFYYLCEKNEKVGEGWIRLEEVGRGRRKLERVGEGCRKLEKVRERVNKKHEQVRKTQHIPPTELSMPSFAIISSTSWHLWYSQGPNISSNSRKFPGKLKKSGKIWKNGYQCEQVRKSARPRSTMGLFFRLAPILFTTCYYFLLPFTTV